MWPDGASRSVTSPVAPTRLLDACLDLLALHPAPQVRDLENAARDAREPADDVPRRGQEEEEQDGEYEEHRRRSNDSPRRAGPCITPCG